MTFFVTFGQKYRTEPHPYLGHPDGWSEVQAETYADARDKVINRYGTQWCWIYTGEEFEPTKNLYPNGLIERIV